MLTWKDAKKHTGRGRGEGGGGGCRAVWRRTDSFVYFLTYTDLDILMNYEYDGSI